MGIQKIPMKFIATCDGCGLKVEQNNEVRPSRWAKLKVERSALDWQNNPCADASIEVLLCENCSPIVVEAVNEAVEERRKANADG